MLLREDLSHLIYCMFPKEIQARLRNRYRREMAGHFGCRRVALRAASPIISFTFDDFPASALQMGGAILRRYGIAGTYYTSFGLMEQGSPMGQMFSMKDIETLLADGHELGCHTFSHCHAWETEAAVFERSVLDNRRALGNQIPGAQFTTLSYPIADPNPGIKRRMSQYFPICRGGGRAGNVGKIDLNNLRSVFLEKDRDNPAFIKDLVIRNRSERGWLVLSTHDIREEPSRFGCTPTFFEAVVRWAVDSGARILPLGTVLEAISLDEV